MAEAQHSSHLRVAAICGAVTLGMLGMSYAAVPLYKLFCQVTGYAGTTQRAEAPTGTVLDRQITIRFDANISNALDWDFTPSERTVNLRIGEKGQTHYVARNLSSEATFGTANFNVSPQQAGAYFNKIECFCFTRQELRPGESVEMPVIFFVDPEIATDPLLKSVTEITLSYTFFPDDTVNETAAAVTSGSKKANSNL